MNYLLDTHTLLWFMTDDHLLSKKAKGIIEIVDNNCRVSVASLWEMSIKMSLDKLQLAIDFTELELFLFENGIDILPANLTHFEILTSLPFFHRDPFDRLLISQCIAEGLAFITKDELVGLYKDVTTVW